MAPEAAVAPAPAASAPAEVTEQTAEQQAAQAEAAEQVSPEKPAELTDAPANEDEAAHEKAAADILEGGLKEPEAAAETTEEAEETTEEAPKEGTVSLAASLFPDQEFGSEEEATKAITEFVNESREYREKQEGATKRLAELFRGNPDLVDLIHLMNEGASMSEALPYVTGEADDTGVEGAKEGWRKTAADKRKAKADQEKSVQEISKNVEVSMQNIKKFADENNMSDEEAAEFLEGIDEVMSNVSRGNITNEIMTKLLKGMKHDKVVADETEKAEIKGRNEAIKETKTKQAEKKGDGLPHPKSTATEKAETEEGPESPADVLSRNIDHVTGSRRF